MESDKHHPTVIEAALLKRMKQRSGDVLDSVDLNISCLCWRVFNKLGFFVLGDSELAGDFSYGSLCAFAESFLHPDTGVDQYWTLNNRPHVAFLNLCWNVSWNKCFSNIILKWYEHYLVWYRLEHVRSFYWATLFQSPAFSTQMCYSFFFLSTVVAIGIKRQQQVGFWSSQQEESSFAHQLKVVFFFFTFNMLTWHSQVTVTLSYTQRNATVYVFLMFNICRVHIVVNY